MYIKFNGWHHKWYAGLTRKIAAISSKSTVFLLACSIIVAWLVSGPIFEFSNSWQLVINSLTTVVTFLMVFVIQNTQSRDTESIQLKLDELIRATEGAHNVLLSVEDLSDEAIESLRERYADLALKAREKMKTSGKLDTDSPHVL